MATGYIARAAATALLLAVLADAALAAEGGDFAPQNIQQTDASYNRICWFHPLCPVSDDVRALIKRAIANDRSAEYRLGLTLLTGDGLPRDRDAGTAWVVRAAEHGDGDAARDIAGRLRNGASITIDETKVAAALKPQADAGDVGAMRALAPMIIAGRGVKQDPALGLGMLTSAAQKGSSDAEKDLSALYLSGAPGVPANRPEALRWLAVSARHGNVDAMLSLGYMSTTAPRNERDLAEGFCWLMRAALLNQPQAQEKLSTIFAGGEKDDRGVAIAVDLVQADLWFRLAARSPYHDNSQIRAMIEPNMTTDQLNQAKQLVGAWQPRTLDDLRTVTIQLPAANGAAPRNCAGFN